MPDLKGSEAQDWHEIPGFPNYAINSQGVIANTERGGIALRYDVNQVGIVHVSLYSGGRQHRRSVAKMVAQSFLQAPTFSHYNTIIHLDGDRQHLYASNLMWRPRWYAVEYHRQFYEKLPDPSWEDLTIEVPKTGQCFNRCVDFCKEYGVLIRHVAEALMNDKPLPLIWMEVRSPELSPLS